MRKLILVSFLVLRSTPDERNMKRLKKILLLSAIIMVCGFYYCQAQIYVNVRPVMPHFERVVTHGPRHVWIDEEWEPRSGFYVFVGGHWVRRPRCEVWLPGDWRRR